MAFIGVFLTAVAALETEFDDVFTKMHMSIDSDGVHNQFEVCGSILFCVVA